MIEANSRRLTWKLQGSLPLQKSDCFLAKKVFFASSIMTKRKFDVSSRANLSLIIFIWFPATVFASCSRADAPIFKPGPGGLLLLATSTGQYFVNTESDSYTRSHHPQHGHASLKANLISDQNGNHVVQGNCSGSFNFELTMLNGETISSPSGTNPMLRVNLRRGFRYKLKANFGTQTICHIGVRLPNSTASHPGSGLHVYRSFSLYRTGSYFAQLYNLTQIDSTADKHRFFDVHPSLLEAKPIFYKYKLDVEGSRDDFAYIFSGVFQPKILGNFSFETSCNRLCRFNLTKRDETRPTLTVKDSGTTGIHELSKEYCISFKVLGRGSLKIFQHGSDGSKTAVTPGRRLWFSHSADTNSKIDAPTMTVLNSSAIQVRLASNANLYPKDRWQPQEKYEIACYGKNEATLLKQFNLTGRLPQERILTGLKNYTTYRCYAHYFGSLPEGVQYNIVSNSRKAQTSENVPSASPRNLRGSSKTLEMNIQWDAIPSSDWQGVPRGYNVYYRVMTKDKGWQSIETDVKSYTFKGKSLQHEFYEFKVCGKTKAGIGICSKTIALRPHIPFNQIKELSGMSYSTELRFMHKKLVSSTQATYIVASVKECFQRCISCHHAAGPCLCASFNVQRFAQGGSGPCEVNRKSADDTPQNLVTDKDYQHYTVLSVLY